MSRPSPRKAAAPVGITMTLIALFTGAVWGQPMWGTWWAWDPRLTSFLILFLFYSDTARSGRRSRTPTRRPISRACSASSARSSRCCRAYAVLFWNQGLHQGASLSLDAEENIADVFWFPLLVSIAGFVLLFVALVLYRTRTEIRARRLHAIGLRERLA